MEDERFLVRRRLVDEVEKQAALHTLVFLVGDGGSGKSVMAAQYLGNEGASRFVAVVAAVWSRTTGRAARSTRGAALATRIVFKLNRSPR